MSLGDEYPALDPDDAWMYLPDDDPLNWRQTMYRLDSLRGWRIFFIHQPEIEDVEVSPQYL